MSSTDHYWALPEGISEALPEQALQLEQLRRELLDIYATWGYQLVMPPLVEYMESLSTGSGSRLDIQTFKVTDQLNGRMLGIRADMTPQIARIDAHKLRHRSLNRLCYMGSVLQTRPRHGKGSRSPLQVGAELFGHSGIDSDFEVISLLLNTLQHCTKQRITLDIGHVGIFRGLIKQAQFNQQQEDTLHDILIRKSLPEMQQWLQQAALPAQLDTLFAELLKLHGDFDILQQASTVLADSNQEVHQALDYLKSLCQRIQTHFPNCQLHIDLTELSGYDYHTGIVYAAYLDGMGYEIARGGRYDGIGRLFGRSRPATGFSTDLRLLAAQQSTQAPAANTILAPASDDPQLRQRVHELRQQGQCVIYQLSGSELSAQQLNCQQQLGYRDDKWILETITD